MFNRTPERIAAAQRREAAKEHARRQKREEAWQRERQHAIALAEQQRNAESLERIRDHEIRYANTIILLGYGGFFALWATQASKLPNQALGIAGLLISISLLAFVGFELAKIVAVSRAVAKGGKLKLAHGQTIDLANDYLDKVQAWWLPVFLLSTVAGFGAGSVLLYSFAVMAMKVTT